MIPIIFFKYTQKLLQSRHTKSLMNANTSTYPYYFRGINLKDTYLRTKSGFRRAACCSTPTGWDTGCKQYRNKTCYDNSKLQAKDANWYYFRKHTCYISCFGPCEPGRMSILLNIYINPIADFTTKDKEK